MPYRGYPDVFPLSSLRNLRLIRFFDTQTQKQNVPPGKPDGQLVKKSLRVFCQAAFKIAKLFCSTVLQFCRCGGLLNAKGNPDGFLSHFSSLRNLRLGRFFDSLSQPAWRSVTAIQADNFCGIFAALILWHKASGFVIARAFAILTKPCANREFCAGPGCPLSYRARALLSRRIQKSDRLI